MKVLKKIVQIIVIVFVCFMAIGYCASKSKKEKKAQATEQVAASTENQQTKVENDKVETKAVENKDVASEEKGSNKNDPASIVGEYTFKDDVMTWTMVVNEDKTLEIKSQRGTYYGSWYFRYNIYHITMSDEFYVVLNANDELVVYPKIDKDLQWFYTDYNAADAKNPRKRCKLTKIK